LVWTYWEQLASADPGAKAADTKAVKTALAMMMIADRPAGEDLIWLQPVICSDRPLMGRR
jgi:hypothetical protein